jgi:hypothetical protein
MFGKNKIKLTPREEALEVSKKGLSMFSDALVFLKQSQTLSETHIKQNDTEIERVNEEARQKTLILNAESKEMKVLNLKNSRAIDNLSESIGE